MKFFRIDGRYDVIGTGSLLGVKGYGREPKSIPVGSETVIDMYPLDFEEFLWANGVGAPVIEMLKKSLEVKTPVPDALHSRMKQLLLQHVVVGGMPDAVQTFVDTKQMNEVLRIQRDIVRSYEDDMVKYSERKAPLPRNTQAVYSGLKTPVLSPGVIISPLQNFHWMETPRKMCSRSI